MPLPRRTRDEGTEYLLYSNRYAFDSEVLLLFGQYCPNIKSLETTITYDEDIGFFIEYGHKLEELSLDEQKVYLQFCPNLKKVYIFSIDSNLTPKIASILIDEYKEFLPKLENIQNVLEIHSSNVKNK